ncbi:carboxylesterase family protein [Nonomuraea ferruginea]
MDIIAVTRHGKVRGHLQDGIPVFRGIPYAAAPFGAERFRAPRARAPLGGGP